MSVPSERLGRGSSDCCGIAPEVAAPVRAHHGAIPQEHPPSGSFRYPAAREAYNEDRALPRYAAQGGIERVAAHGVEDHVRATSIGELLDPIADIFPLVIDRVVSAVLGGYLRMFLPTSRSDDGGPQALAYLYSGAADVTGTTVYQQHLVRLQAYALRKGEVSGTVGDGERSSGREVHPVWYRQDVHRRYHDPFRVPAVRQHGHHPIAGF